MQALSGVKITGLLVLWYLSVLGFAQAASDDFSYAALQEDAAEVTDDVAEVDSILADDVGFEFVPQALSPNQNQLTQQRITNEFYYIILLSAVALISLFVVLNFLKNHGQCPRDIVNAAGLILIIFGTIILVLVVDTTEQLTAAIGVLGAIAGYLFGTIQSDKQAKSG